MSWEPVRRLFRRYPKVVHTHDEGWECDASCVTVKTWKRRNR